MTIKILENIVTISILVFKIIIAYLETIFSLFPIKTNKSIKNQNVLITGAGHGFGRELALGFARRGANLILIDINKENNAAVKKEILSKNNPVRVLDFCLDITDNDKIAKVAEQIKLDLGHVDILINNAGIVQCKPFLELAPTMVEKTFQVNTLAHIWMIRHFLPQMLERKQGHIVSVSSIAGLVGNKYISDYCASKFAVVGLMEALEKEIHDKNSNENIHFSTICPASMSTGMFKTFTSNFPMLLPISTPEQVAEDAINAILKNKQLIVLPKIAFFLLRLSSLIPKRVFKHVDEYFDYGVKPHLA